MRAPRRARAVINRLLGERKLTETGLAWLVAATDPFHDSAVTPTGFPDLNSTNTLVQCYTQTAAITAPTSAGSGSWDAHFLFCPVLGSAYSDPVLTPFTYTANSFSFATAGGIGAPLYSGYNCVAGAQGFSLISTAASSLTVTQQSPPRRAYGGEYRLVAAGFEVTNTTAELYKGGAVTAWRAPNTPSRLVNVYNSAATTTTPITVYCGNAPPTDQGKAQLYPTAKTWGASDGVYGIATLIGETNPFVIANATQPFFRSSALFNRFGSRQHSSVLDLGNNSSVGERYNASDDTICLAWCYVYRFAESICTPVYNKVLCRAVSIRF